MENPTPNNGPDPSSGQGAGRRQGPTERSAPGASGPSVIGSRNATGAPSVASSRAGGHPSTVSSRPASTEPSVIGSRAATVGPNLARGGTVAVARIVTPQRSVVVPPARNALEDQGWTRTSRAEGSTQVFEGYYTATAADGKRHRFPGRIEVDNWGDIRPFIHNPPLDLMRKMGHPRVPCFAATGGDWYRIHWSEPARDPDTALLFVEGLVTEALTQKLRQRYRR